MNFDIRLPIGLMFGIFGILIAGYGAFADPAIYKRSLGINVNLFWGLAMVVFAAIMLGLAWRAKKAEPTGPATGAKTPPGRH
jgi:hypothetical protein